MPVEGPHSPPSGTCDWLRPDYDILDKIMDSEIPSSPSIPPKLAQQIMADERALPLGRFRAQFTGGSIDWRVGHVKSNRRGGRSFWIQFSCSMNNEGYLNSYIRVTTDEFHSLLLRSDIVYT